MDMQKEKAKLTKQEKLELDRHDRAAKVLRDLFKLYDHRNDQSPEWKLKWMFITFTKMLLCQPAVAAKLQIPSLAEKAGISEEKAFSELKNAYNRAIQSSAGIKQEYLFNMTDMRYRFKNKTIIEWLDITEQEVDILDFQELASELIEHREKLKVAKVDKKAHVIRLPRW